MSQKFCLHAKFSDIGQLLFIINFVYLDFLLLYNKSPDQCVVEINEKWTSLKKHNRLASLF